MDEEGRCKLVGVAVVDPVDDLFMNTFLSLPTECIAYLNATISIATARRSSLLLVYIANTHASFFSCKDLAKAWPYGSIHAPIQMGSLKYTTIDHHR